MSTRPLPTEDLRQAAAQVGPRWACLEGMDLFFTGGTGFVGAWMTAVLLQAIDEGRLTARVRLLTRQAEGVARRLPWLAAHPAVTLVEGDVRQLQAERLAGCTHLVAGATDARATLIQQDPGRMFETVVDGTRRTLEAAVGAGIRRALFLSSGAVHGPQPAELLGVSEDRFFGLDPLRTGAAYAEGKRAAEHLCALAAADGLSLSVARLWAFVGPLLPLDEHFAIGNFLGDALAGRPIRVKGDGTTIRSYQYASEMAAWCWVILAAGQSGRAYHVGSEDGRTMAELAQACGALRNVRAEVLGTPTPGRPVDRYVPDTSRSRTELDLRQVVGLDEALRRTLAWHEGR